MREKNTSQANKMSYAKKDLVLMMIRKCIKVRNHCHNTGKYRGAAHDICNLRYKTPK